jgi:hypothetical protein
MWLFKQHRAPPYYTFYIKRGDGARRREGRRGEIGPLKEQEVAIIQLPA